MFQRIAALFLSAALFIAALCGAAAAHPFDDNPVDPAKALDSFRQMADDNPGDISLQYEYAEVLVTAGKLDEAERVVINRVLTIDPHYDMAYYLLSDVYCRQQKFEKALEPLRKIKAKDTKADALIAEASIYLKLRKPEKCLEKARAAMKADPANPGGHLHAGLAFMELGRAKEGMRHIEISLRMDPYQPMVYEQLKQIYRDNLTLEQQIKKLESFLDIAPSNSDFGNAVRNDIQKLKSPGGEKN